MNANPITPRIKNKNLDLSSGLRRDFVYDEITSRIKSRTLRPGDRLREMDLAKELGVSRTPVREALKRLENEGVATLLQARVLIVTELTHQKVMELYAMREVLVGTAARFAADQAAPLEIQNLLHIASQQNLAVTPQEASTLDYIFHDALVDASHNDYLKKALEVLSNTIALLMNSTYSAPGRIEAGAKENTEISARIAARDSEGAERAGRQHMRNASAARLRMLTSSEKGWSQC